MEQRQEILLEAGTNEMELAEFFLGSQSFGVNVAKIREFVLFDKKLLTKYPGTHSAVMGVFLVRKQAIALIDLNKYLRRKSQESERPVVLVTEFNNMVNAFLIDSVTRIHRLSWKNISPLDPMLAKYSPCITGSVNVQESEILILDLEHIINDIFPNKGGALKEVKVDATENREELLAKRKNIKVVIAEDSIMIRKIMEDSAIKEGYINITSFDNGKSVLEYIKKQKQEAESKNVDIKNYIDIVVSDIEMPKMDGLSLCRIIKHDLKLHDLPVIMFSSLINDAMAVKCRKVGADKYISKPQMGTLIELIDSFSL